MQAGLLGRAPAALTGDDLEFTWLLWVRACEQRLQDASGADGVDKFCERVGVKAGPWLEWAWLQLFDWQRSGRGIGVGRFGRGRVAHQSGKTAAEAWIGAHAATFLWRSSISSASFV